MNATRFTLGATSFSSCSHFPPISETEIRKSGKISSRSRQARNKASADGIGNPREYNWDSLGLFPKGCQDRRAVAEDRLRRRANDFGRVGPEAIRIAVGPAVVGSDIAALHPSRFAKPFLERREARSPFRVALAKQSQHADAPRLLCLRSKRPCKACAAEQCDELSPFHT